MGRYKALSIPYKVYFRHETWNGQL